MPFKMCKNTKNLCPKLLQVYTNVEIKTQKLHSDLFMVG